jgi:hypothetical protein
MTNKSNRASQVVTALMVSLIAIEGFAKETDGYWEYTPGEKPYAQRPVAQEKPQQKKRPYGENEPGPKPSAQRPTAQERWHQMEVYATSASKRRDLPEERYTSEEEQVMLKEITEAVHHYLIVLEMHKGFMLDRKSGTKRRKELYGKKIRAASRHMIHILMKKPELLSVLEEHTEYLEKGLIDLGPFQPKTH